MKKIIFLIITLFLAACRNRSKVTIRPLTRVAVDTFGTVEVSRSLPLLRKAEGEAVRVIVPPQLPDPVRADSVVSGYRFIPLETLDECILGEIEKIYINDAGIWVHDRNNNALFRFDPSGKFICRIGRQGRGAKEYLRLWGFSIDEQRKEVCVHDVDGLKLEYYDFEGHHLRTSPLYFQYDDMELWKDKIITFAMASYNSEIPTVSEVQMVVTDRDNVPRFGILPIVPNPYEKETLVSPVKAIKRGSDGLYYSNVFSDTIWWTDGERYKAAYWLDFGKRGPLFTLEDMEQMTREKYDARISSVPSYFSGAYLPTAKFLWMDVWGKDGGVRFLFSKRTGHVQPINTVYAPPLSKRVGDYLFPYEGKLDFVYDDSTFIKVLQPHDLQYLRKTQELLDRLTPAERKFWGNLDEEANPILMLITIKDF